MGCDPHLTAAAQSRGLVCTHALPSPPQKKNPKKQKYYRTLSNDVVLGLSDHGLASLLLENNNDVVRGTGGGCAIALRLAADKLRALAFPLLRV